MREKKDLIRFKEEEETVEGGEGSKRTRLKEANVRGGRKRRFQEDNGLTSHMVVGIIL